MIDTLLEFGANPDINKYHEMTVWHLAALEGYTF